MGSWSVDTSSGFLTNFRGRVTESYAGTDPRYNNGETTLAMWTVEILEVHQEDYDGDVPEELAISYPCGDGWFSEDGETLEHPKGKERFHASSVYGKIVANVSGESENYGTNTTRTDGEDLAVDLTPLMAIMEDRGTPEDTSVWKDLVFDFAECLIDYGPDRKAKDGSRIETRRTLPIAWIPDEGQAAAKPAKKAPAKKAAAAKKAPAKAAKTEEPVDKVAAAKERAAAAKAAKATPAPADDTNPFTELVDDAELAEQLNTLMVEADDFDSFIAAVTEIAEVMADDDLLAKVVDEDEGPWASRSGG